MLDIRQLAAGFSVATTSDSFVWIGKMHDRGLILKNHAYLCALRCFWSCEARQAGTDAVQVGGIFLSQLSRQNFPKTINGE